MESKFTEGPWHVTTGKHTETTDLYDKGETWINVNGEDGVIADVLFGRCLSADEDEAKANADLMAASPEMYNLLNEIFEEVGLPEPQLSKYMALMDKISAP